MLFSVSDFVVVVTGGGGAIGSRLANAFETQGAIAYRFDLDLAENGENAGARTVALDIADVRAVEKACGEIFAEHGRLDVLVNCAGITLPSTADRPYDLGDWETTIKVNLTGALVCCQVAAEYMGRAGRGSIINITSLNAELGFSKNPAYVASKGGLKMLTKALAFDYGPKGVRVNNLGPGYIRTPMTEASYGDPQARAAREERTMLGRWGEVDDLVGPCMFLASDASSYVTGLDLYVDGGWLAKGL